MDIIHADDGAAIGACGGAGSCGVDGDVSGGVRLSFVLGAARGVAEHCVTDVLDGACGFGAVGVAGGTVIVVRFCDMSDIIHPDDGGFWFGVLVVVARSPIFVCRQPLYFLVMFFFDV